MAINNIQVLFATITPEQVSSYLKGNGWQLTASETRLDFEKNSDNADDSLRVFLPAQRAHSKYRGLLANLIYSLAVIEQCEAIDIANAIHKARLDATTSASELPPPDPVRHFILRNQSSTVASIKLSYFSSFGAGISCGVGIAGFLHPGEHVHVQLFEQAQPYVIDFAGDVVIGTGGNILPNVLLPLPTASEAAPQDLTQWLNGPFAALFDEDATQAVIETRESERMIAQFHFALDGVLELCAKPAPLLRASATFLCQLIQRLTENTKAKGVVFDLARQLVSSSGLTFKLAKARWVGWSQA